MGALHLNLGPAIQFGWKVYYLQGFLQDSPKDFFPLIFNFSGKDQTKQIRQRNQEKLRYIDIYIYGQGISILNHGLQQDWHIVIMYNV